MGRSSRSSRGRKKKKSLEDESSSSSSYFSSSPSLSSSDDRESSDRRRRRKRSSRHRESSSSKKKHHSSSKKSLSSRKRKATRDEEKRRKRRKHRSDDDDESGSEPEQVRDEPETLARSIVDKFPDIATDLEQLLQMIDNGQGVDVRGLSDKSLVKNLKRLFISLKLKQNESGVFLLPPHGHRTLNVIGPILSSHLKSRNKHLSNSGSPIREQPSHSDLERGRNEVNMDDARMTESIRKDEPPTPRRRIVLKYLVI